jgi:hypothetical protein
MDTMLPIRSLEPEQLKKGPESLVIKEMVFSFCLFFKIKRNQVFQKEKIKRIEISDIFDKYCFKDVQVLKWLHNHYDYQMIILYSFDIDQKTTKTLSTKWID